MRKTTLFSRSVRYFLLLCVVLGSAPYYGLAETSSAQLEKLQHKLSQLQLRYTDKHPDVKKLKNRIHALEKKIVAEEASQPEAPDPLSEKKSVQQDGKNASADRKKANRNIQKKQQPATKKKIKDQGDDFLIKNNGQVRGSAAAIQKDIHKEKLKEIRFFTDSGILNVPVNVKETAGVGAEGYPVSAVIPLPFGKYQGTEKFRLVDAEGDDMPAQFEVLNRWWARGNSIRHLLVHFQPSLSAFSATGSGRTTYYLKDDGAGTRAATSLTVEETEKQITITTGPLKFTVNKETFNIIDEAWLDLDKNSVFNESEKIIQSDPRNGGVFIGRMPGDNQQDSSRTDISFTVEEKGPMRVVIRAEAPTIYNSPENHTHGFAVRIYAYSDKPYVKIDYQLQNSAKNVVFSWPLYFEEMNLDFRLRLRDPITVRVGLENGRMYERKIETGLYLAQEFHDKFHIYDLRNNQVLGSGQVAGGVLDVRDSSKGVAAIGRHFWQMWPNGMEIDGNNKLQIQLFPRWSSQWRQKEGITPRFTDTGLYWLQDMQHVYKEMMLVFHGADERDEDLVNLARTFQQCPVANLPTAWYTRTRSTLDLGGLIPIDQKMPGRDLRSPKYKKKDYNVEKSTQYNFGWNQFLLDINRKWGASQGGGWPYSVESFIATENPVDYYFAEQFAIGELNVRPQWMAHYDFEKDGQRLQLTENPYAGKSWRKIKGGNFDRHFAAPFLGITNMDAKPRDDAHGWFYHVEEAYYFTGNPWIKDWYKFVAEFRKTRLNHLDPYTSKQTRATAHALAHALQAYRVTGDLSIISGFRKYLNQWLRPEQSPLTGSVREGKGDRASWVGYLSRAIISFMEEVKENNWQAYAEAFNYLSGLMEWNYLYSNFSYGINADKGQTGESSHTAQNMADPQAWYYWHTGTVKFLDHMNRYIDQGINGGQKAPARIKNWNGRRFQGRWVQFVRENEKPDMDPPAPIIDLRATKTGKHIELSWTAPQDAFRYHIIWSDKPISEESITDPSYTNWWAANVKAFVPEDNPSEKLKVRVTPNKTKPFYAVIFSFDVNENMSRMSNVTSTQQKLLLW